MTDIIAGQVAYYFGTMPSSMPLAKAGKLRALAVTSLTRSPAAPEVPTIAESGYPKFETAAWYGLMFPTGTPREIVARTNAATMVVLALPDIRERLVHEGSEPWAARLRSSAHTSRRKSRSGAESSRRRI